MHNLQKPFAVELYRNMNLSCLFKNTARQVYSKALQTIFNYIDAPSFKKFHTETVKGKVKGLQVCLAQLKTQTGPKIWVIGYYDSKSVSSISQGSVATRFRCGETFSDDLIIHLMVSLKVKNNKNGQHLAKLPVRV